MYNYTDIIGKKVLTVYEGEFVGTVISIKFTKKLERLHSLVLEDKEGGILSLMRDRIFAVGDNILIKNAHCLNVVPEENTTTIINNSIINLSGKDLGRVTQLVFDDKFYVKFLINKNTQFNYQKILNIGKNFILFNDTQKVYKMMQFSHRKSFAKLSKKSNLVEVTKTIENISIPPTIIAKLPRAFSTTNK